MWLIVLIGVGVCGAYLAGRTTVQRIKERVVKAGAGDDVSAMGIVAKGVMCVKKNIGPWTAQDLLLGLTAIAKVTAKDPPQVPGHPAEEAEDEKFLFRAQHWRALAEAVYVGDSASFSLFSHLPESSIVASKWNPDQETLRPAYALCLDPVFGALVLSVRGTSHVIDMLVSTGTSPVPFMGGHAHAGFARATDSLLEEIGSRIEGTLAEHENLRKLVIVGHSMGAAVGIMCGLKLKDRFKDLECWGYAVPAALSMELARKCSRFATCFVCFHDIVPRFSLASIEGLRKRVCGFDWKRAEETIGRDDEDWQKILKAVEMMETFKRAQDGIGENVGNFQRKVCEVMGGGDKKGDGACSSKAGESEEEGKGKGEVLGLYPAGRLLVLCSDPPGCGLVACKRSDVAEQRNYGAFPSYEQSKRVKWMMNEVRQEDLSEIVLSPWCVSDHMLGNLCEGINYLQMQTAPLFIH